MYTEKQAWMCVAEVFEYAAQEKWPPSKAEQRMLYGGGICAAVAQLLRAGNITEATYWTMLDRLKEYFMPEPLRRYYWWDEDGDGPGQRVIAAQLLAELSPNDQASS